MGSGIWVDSVMLILCLSWVGPRGVTSVKIRVAIGVPARGAGGV